MLVRDAAFLLLKRYGHDAALAKGNRDAQVVFRTRWALAETLVTAAIDALERGGAAAAPPRLEPATSDATRPGSSR